MITLSALIAGRIKESRWSSPGHGINNYLLIKALGTEHLFLVGYNLCSVTRLHIILLLFFPLSLENKVLIYDVDPSATWPTPPPRRGQIAHPCYFLSHYRMNYIFEAVLWRWGGKKERREKGERKKNRVIATAFEPREYCLCFYQSCSLKIYRAVHLLRNALERKILSSIRMENDGEVRYGLMNFLKFLEEYLC